jgi:hypothetical protein
VKALTYYASPISRSGKIAGYTTSACLVGAGVAFTIASVAVVSCEGRCGIEPALGGLALYISIPCLLLGLAVGRGVRRRPVDTEGESGWSWGIAAVLATGIAVLASRIPSLTCSQGGRLDGNFAICITASLHRYDATSWIWLKWLVLVVGIAVALVAGWWRRAPRVTAVGAALAWAVGFGWLLADSLGRELFR